MTLASAMLDASSISARHNAEDQTRPRCITSGDSGNQRPFLQDWVPVVDYDCRRRLLEKGGARAPVETQPRLHDRVRGIFHNRASRESLCKIHTPPSAQVTRIPGRRQARDQDCAN